jgi:hypothetical protein
LGEVGLIKYTIKKKLENDTQETTQKKTWIGQGERGCGLIKYSINETTTKKYTKDNLDKT